MSDAPEPRPGEEITDAQHAKYHWGVPLSAARQTWLRGLADRQQEWAAQPAALRGDSVFQDVSLTGADVAWLAHLARGDQEGESVPRLHLEGAYLAFAHLEGAELVAAHLEEADLAAVHLEGATLDMAHLEDANLYDASLEGASLGGAHLEGATLLTAHLAGADLSAAHLEGADLGAAHLEGRRLAAEEWQRLRQWATDLPEVLAPANLRLAFFTSASDLGDMTVGDAALGFVCVADVRWGSVNLAIVDWTPSATGAESSSRGTRGQRRLPDVVLGDEREARRPRDAEGKTKGAEQRLADFETAVRANRQLATALRDQGLNEDADHFAYRAQLLQRQVLWRQGHVGRALGSWLLDAVSGYGYKPMRSVWTYVVVILTFAAAYFFITTFGITPFLPTHSTPLAWYEALVLSIGSFHGRGLYPSGLNLGDPVAILAAGEAIIGLLIEITFIATFTQRFFAR
jgi:uncharacterized protein YjbI with pentapeptide repeats